MKKDKSYLTMEAIGARIARDLYEAAVALSKGEAVLEGVVFNAEAAKGWLATWARVKRTEVPPDLSVMFETAFQAIPKDVHSRLAARRLEDASLVCAEAVEAVAESSPSYGGFRRSGDTGI